MQLKMTLSMKKYSPILFLFLFSCVYSQGTKQPTFKKRVLESTEVDFLASYYVQDGSKSSVSGGIGSAALLRKLNFSIIFLCNKQHPIPAI